MTKARKMAIFADGIDVAIEAVNSRISSAQSEVEWYENRLQEWKEENPDASQDDIDYKTNFYKEQSNTFIDQIEVWKGLVSTLENMICK